MREEDEITAKIKKNRWRMDPFHISVHLQMDPDRSQARHFHFISWPRVFGQSQSDL